MVGGGGTANWGSGCWVVWKSGVCDCVTVLGVKEELQNGRGGIRPNGTMKMRGM